MTIEKTMLIPLACLIVVLAASGLIIHNQIGIQHDHMLLQKEVAGMLKDCPLRKSP